MKAEPQKEHQWLQKLVGEWTMEASMPDQPGAKSKGQETVRALGDVWVIGEGTGEMPGGGTGSSVITIGFDPRTRRFVGTWIGSMMTHMWVYDGWLDESGRILTLESDGPSMTDPNTLGKYRDVIEFVSDDHRTLTAHSLGADGKWQNFMIAQYRRKK